MESWPGSAGVGFRKSAAGYFSDKYNSLRESKSGIGTLPHTHNRSSMSDTSSYDEKCSLLVFVCLF